MPKDGIPVLEPNDQMYLSLINGYLSAEKYFNVLILRREVEEEGGEFKHELIESFMYASVNNMAMQLIEKAQ
jgi:hypothetical protein